MANDISKKNSNDTRWRNLIIFLTASAIIAKCAEIYAGSSLRMSGIAFYISIFLFPLIAFAAGIIAKPLAVGSRPRINSLAYILAAYILLKAVNCIIGIYVSEKSVIEVDDQSWVFLALAIWTLAAWALRRVKPVLVVILGILLGTAAGFLPIKAPINDVLKAISYFPFFMMGHYANSDSLAVLEKRWLKVTAFFASVIIAVVLIAAVPLEFYTGIFAGKVIPGEPLCVIAAGLISYIFSALVAALWFCAIPSRRFFFTDFAKRSFQVFFFYWIIIELWQHFDMNLIFYQIWAEHWKLFFFLAILIVMAFIAILPLPFMSNFIDRVRTGKWRLPDAGDPVFKRIKQYSFLFSELVKRDFKKKYKRTVLGMLWSVLSPLFSLLVMWLVFSQFFGRNTPHYIIFVFAGNLVYSYFRESTNEGMTSLVGNAGIFTKVNVPKYMFIFSKNISSLISFCLTLIVFFAFVAADGLPFTWKYIMLLYPIFCLIMFNVGVGLILSALFVFFKDIKYLWSIFTMLLMYMSAIFYNIESYSATAQNLFLLNPIYVYIRYFRKIVIENTIPTLWFHLIALGYAFFFFYLGFHMYKKNNTKFLYYV